MEGQVVALNNLPLFENTTSLAKQLSLHQQPQ